MQQRNPAHMQANIDWFNTLPALPVTVVAELHERFATNDDGWMQKG